MDNTPEAWVQYRSQIEVPWDEKRNEAYFIGSFTGRHDALNSRLRACQLMLQAGLPTHMGILPFNVPPELAGRAPLLAPEPLSAMAQYRFVLSLSGNHPWNPRIYRGLEGGSLVFHQATPTIRHLDDGILQAQRHFVEIAPDLSDLVAKVQYFIDRPAEARDIAEEGHKTWMENLYAELPYSIPAVMWDRLTGQAGWQEFLEAFDVHN